MPAPDHRIDRSSYGVLFVYKNLSYESFGIDEVVKIDSQVYRILGVEGFFGLSTTDKSVAIRVRRLSA